MLLRDVPPDLTPSGGDKFAIAYRDSPILRLCTCMRCCGSQHSIGGSYFGWAWRTPAVQRLKHQTHVGTLASPGACSQGETGLQCEILGLLQNGCLGRCKLTDEEGAAFEQEVRSTFTEIMEDRQQ